jgi:hypothetical protein
VLGPAAPTWSPHLAIRVRRLTRRAPPGHPYGVGNGRRLNTRVFVLVPREDDLGLYRPHAPGPS